jgi:hypothetical protein
MHIVCPHCTTSYAIDMATLGAAGRTEIYAWNALLEQAVLNPGERARFKSRLASPPPEGRNIDVRFFSKRDIAGGSV